MTAPTSITVTPVHVADLMAEGELVPVYVYVIDHPDARVLVDTGMTKLHPLVADNDPAVADEVPGPRYTPGGSHRGAARRATRKAR